MCKRGGDTSLWWVNPNPPRRVGLDEGWKTASNATYHTWQVPMAANAFAPSFSREAIMAYDPSNYLVPTVEDVKKMNEERIEREDKARAEEKLRQQIKRNKIVFWAMWASVIFVATVVLWELVWGVR